MTPIELLSIQEVPLPSFEKTRVEGIPACCHFLLDNSLTASPLGLFHQQPVRVAFLDLRMRLPI
jgi:hypothetical protein